MGRTQGGGGNSAIFLSLCTFESFPFSGKVRGYKGPTHLPPGPHLTILCLGLDRHSPISSAFVK